jgi:hypothetical protein
VQQHENRETRPEPPCLISLIVFLTGKNYNYSVTANRIMNVQKGKKGRYGKKC